jgi:hypothetical protein
LIKLLQKEFAKMIEDAVSDPIIKSMMLLPGRGKKQIYLVQVNIYNVDHGGLNTSTRIVQNLHV